MRSNSLYTSLSYLLAYLVCHAASVTETAWGQYQDDCPELCHVSGPNPTNWTQFHRLQDLVHCDKDTVIFNLNVHTQVGNLNVVGNSAITIRACLFTGHGTYKHDNTTLISRVENLDSYLPSSVETDCGAKPHQSSAIVTYGSAPAPETAARHDARAAAKSLAAFIKHGGSRCGVTILFSVAADKKTVLGMYAGSEIQKSSIASFLELFDGDSAVQQICATNGTAARTIGIYATALDDLDSLREGMKMWATGHCVKTTARPGKVVQLGMLESATSTNSTTKRHMARIRGSTLTSLKGKRALADHKPRPKPDGTCYDYQVQANDGCWAIANANYITQEDISNFNKFTWGWAGCGQLQAGQIICLSKGRPPMPGAIPNAMCGPQVPGTRQPSGGEDIADLNPCPLNACCDIWGFCGTSAEFCTKSPAETGNPGTTMPGTASCISNCEMKIVNNEVGPSSRFSRVGYFEAWNYKRKCLNMDVTQINMGAYSHIHFSFATLTPSFDVSLEGIEDQFQKFLQLPTDGAKKILSFGGWAFSTEPATFQRFRDATNAKNRERFSNLIVEFTKKNAIDGVDFDWEYPGAPDIPDVPTGGKDEGNNYLEFLKLLKSKLPSSISVSIALPASFWYLKQYPVKDIADVVDYFIYMSYDLHGQWDMGNKWSVPSCPAGNCLRSHVNKTETENSLVMITKAGVKSNKIMVGISSYGRSFRMSSATCRGSMCTFTGTNNQSNAFPGQCTDTPGYISNAEIQHIIDYGESSAYGIVSTYFDNDSDSNILVYGTSKSTSDWVAYMNPDTKMSRIKWYQDMNFAGVSDWAIDLQTFHESIGSDDGDDKIPDIPSDDDIFCTSAKLPKTLEDLVTSRNSISSQCWHRYAMSILYDDLDKAMEDYNNLLDGYDKEFDYYKQWIEDSISPRLETYMALDGGPGNKYFTCHWRVGPGRRTEPCPPSNRFWQTTTMGWDITYELKDEKGFYEAVEKDLGIVQEWIRFGTKTEEECLSGDTPWRAGKGGSACKPVSHNQMGLPMKAEKVEVANPKGIIEAAKKNITSLQDTMLIAFTEMAFLMYGLGDDEVDVDNPDTGNAVISAAMPVFMIQDAVANMKVVKEIGKEVAEQKKKQLIMLILSIVLMVIPFVGELAGPLIGGAAMVTRIITLLAEVGNAAVGIVEIIDEPMSAPFVILGIVAGAAGAGAGGAAGSRAFRKAAAARKGMGRTQLAKFSDTFQDKDRLIQKLTNACKLA